MWAQNPQPSFSVAIRRPDHRPDHAPDFGRVPKVRSCQGLGTHRKLGPSSTNKNAFGRSQDLQLGRNLSSNTVALLKTLLVCSYALLALANSTLPLTLYPVYQGLPRNWVPTAVLVSIPPENSLMQSTGPLPFTCLSGDWDY
jgi:hypothetical protein